MPIKIPLPNCDSTMNGEPNGRCPVRSSYSTTPSPNTSVPDQALEVRQAFTHRWTVDNKRREEMWQHVATADQPTIPLSTDPAWLGDHAFCFLDDGSRLCRTTKHAEPAYVAESGVNPKHKKTAGTTLSFSIGAAPKMTRKTARGEPGPRLRDELALAIAADRAHVDATRAAAARIGRRPPRCAATGLEMIHGNIYVDQAMKHWPTGGLYVSERTALMLANGDMSFVSLEHRYDDRYREAADWYCKRCDGTGAWSRKRPTNRRCNRCEGTGLAPAGLRMEQLSQRPIWSQEDVDYILQVHAAVSPDLHWLLLSGRLHRIGDNAYVCGTVLESLYRNYFIPHWRDASPSQILTRDASFISSVRIIDTVSRCDAVLLLRYFKGHRSDVSGRGVVVATQQTQSRGTREVELS